MTRQVWKTLNDVNALANGAIEPISNLEHWGTTLDHWDYPVDGKGDCKIYALFKRKLLIERGFPRQALLMTIVRDLNGEGHAVLTVKTDRGDFVLDNLSDDVRPWNATGYTFFKRQAQDDPNVWLSLGGATGAAPTEAAGLRARSRLENRTAARRRPGPLLDAEQRQHDAARDRGAEHAGEVRPHRVVDEVVLLVVLERHVVADPRRDRHRGDAGRAEQRVDLLLQEQVHDLGADHARAGAEHEGEQAEDDDLDRACR